MKFLILLLSFGFTFNAFAQSKSLDSTVTGTVIFEKKTTMSCLGVSCPPSQTYYQASLVKANIAGYGAVKKVDLLDLTSKFNLKKKPASMIYKGVRVKEGMKIMVDAEIKVMAFDMSKVAYGYIAEAKKVRAVSGKK